MYQNVTEACIADVVHTFYARVRRDELLGPIFDEAIGGEWQEHLAKMKAFWSTVLLAARTYKGNPMLAHLQLPRLMPQHFERWLELWRETTGELCDQGVASIFVGRAEMIAERFLYAIAAYHGTAMAESAGTVRPTI